ncbi:hypothetical protein [Mesorhizobium sp. B2-4-13]|uniref:hypothetical protein n=1 Tax=Mesorhizobium sp. B2-4-13 TaxID=2589936 RepID=UPI001FEF100A|nr:hypothetical protein [Mesorhizobium sp. B2-4-13]
MTPDIETIGIAALFGSPSPARDRADAGIMAAAAGIGFLAVRDFPGNNWLTPDKRAQLLRIFALPDAEKQELLRWNFDHTKKISTAAGFRCSRKPFPTRKVSTWGRTLPMRRESRLPTILCASPHRCRTRMPCPAGALRQPTTIA